MAFTPAGMSRSTRLTVSHLLLGNMSNSKLVTLGIKTPSKLHLVGSRSTKVCRDQPRYAYAWFGAFRVVTFDARCVTRSGLEVDAAGTRTIST